MPAATPAADSVLMPTDHSPSPLGLFAAFGVELEYMIVDAETLNIRPIADEVFRAVTGEITGEYETPDITWSNELALHVIELKTSQPAASLDGLSAQFASHVGQINQALVPLGALLLPTAMHPWMDPAREMRLWPHDYSPVYEAFNRVFDCRGHGWANLQSVHINLPFRGDEEFGRLHAAIRLLLPILPALAASSPIVEGRATGMLDSRLDVYRTNARRVPSISADVIPEPVFTKADYDEQIFRRIYADIAPYDAEGILQHEWLNARGAIARFTRGAIEIRVLDIQECPAADLAIVRTVVEVLRHIVDQRFTSAREQESIATAPLKAILLDTIRDADEARITDATYLRQLGIAAGNGRTGAEVWQELVEITGARQHLCNEEAAALDNMLTRGPLARRIVRALHSADANLNDLYRQLSNCLAQNRGFVG
jgi:gamma-glutamyl:cysteine ligase YbdK (ATP-grasp superfamily)